MKTKLVALLVLLLVPLLALGLGLGAACVSQRPVEVGLVDGRLRPCPDSPNCVCSESPDGEASVEPLAFEGDPARAFRSLLDFLAAESRARVLEVQDGYAHVVYVTPFLKFADDVEFRLDAEHSVIHVRSASRIGHSDLGTNRERIESLRRRWRPPVASDSEPTEGR